MFLPFRHKHGIHMQSSLSVSDMPPNLPPPPPPPQPRGNRGRGALRPNIAGGRSRPRRNVSSSQSHLSSQLMRSIPCTNDPFNLSALALTTSSPGSASAANIEIDGALSPLQCKLDGMNSFAYATKIIQIMHDLCLYAII